MIQVTICGPQPCYEIRTEVCAMSATVPGARLLLTPGPDSLSRTTGPNSQDWLQVNCFFHTDAQAFESLSQLVRKGAW